MTEKSPGHVDPKTAARVAVAGQLRRNEARQAPPPDQTCQRCGATFRWNRAAFGDGWTMRLLQASSKCDCGYGKVEAPPAQGTYGGGREDQG